MAQRPGGTHVYEEASVVSEALLPQKVSIQSFAIERKPVVVGIPGVSSLGLVLRQGCDVKPPTSPLALQANYT